MLSILCLLLTFSGLPSTEASIEPLIIEGATMGTTYRIVYFDEPRRRILKREVDSVLAVVNKAINTYDPRSETSRFNRAEKEIRRPSAHLLEILSRAAAIYEQSKGAFDPTVMPLVNAWGFGPQKGDFRQVNVDSLKQIVGFDKVCFSGKKLLKTDARVQLDFGGIGQGYGADVIYRLFESKGINHVLVELGGEGVAQGRNLRKDAPWTIGILHPNSTPSHQFFHAYVTPGDRAFTTSGNYFNYRVVDGRKLGHTIDPVSGRPVEHSLLSASVFAADCTTADGWATAFMVMGFERAKIVANTLPGVDAIFMYSNDDGTIATYITPGIESSVVLE